MEYKVDAQARGVRIIAGDETKQRRELLNQLIGIAEQYEFSEIILPSIEPAVVYTEKAGPEVLGQMYAFPDKKGRELCLRPEGTATIQLLADKHFKNQKDVKLWYFERCWRYERPSLGRYREFFQFGLEVLNPGDKGRSTSELIDIAQAIIATRSSKYEINRSVKRGLAYYTEDGFEISVPSLGAQKQVLGGGAYKQGVGFALGFDRLMLS
ncbi:ATP phosphoribosyltransferase regulatory subunit [Arenicella sp. 4NH20-0111]|uniref:ATP phosphoribosyltransferase regulatory subunit n=1 Tax=Arenicella sp. 4NH20-0111 TaxID=3127648 RepID=UPI00310A01F5